jgi:chemotaxis protein histidine kinase CheA
MKQVDDETREIFESFVAEAFDRLDDAEAVLSKAECQDDSDCLGTVFRLFHSVKGCAGFLNLNQVRELTHEAETLLEVHLKEGAAVTPESLDVIYQTIDVLRELVKYVQTEFSDEDFDNSATGQVAVIRRCIDQLRSSKAAGTLAEPVDGIVDIIPAGTGDSLGDEIRTGLDNSMAGMSVTAPPGTLERTASPADFLDHQPSRSSHSNRSNQLSQSDTDEPPGLEPNEIILNELVTRDMTERFLAESADLVDHIESDALGLLSSRDVAEDVHAMFRAVHTIKGNAGFFGYELLESMCMEAEAHLDKVRKGLVPASEVFVNNILAHVDAMRDAIKSVLILDDAFVPPPPESGRRSGEWPQADDLVGPSAGVGINAASTGLAALDSGRMVPETAVPGGAVPGGVVPGGVVPGGVVPGGNAATTGGNVQSAGSGMSKRARTAASASTASPSATPAAVAPAKATSANATPAKATSAKAAPAARPEATGIDMYRPIGEILVDMGAADEAAIFKALEIQEKPLGELLVESGAASREDVAKALEVQRTMEARPSAEAGPEEIQRREIRVDTVKLDKLFDLVGELITAEAMVLNSPDLKGLKRDHFDKSFNTLNKISREIQETTMAIRMIPMEGLFHKMTRLVRDLSRKFGKPVDFRVSGQETEMDKNVIEQISDPLVHILRNSIDHGLEFPAERKGTGKPDAGMVSLDARYEGSEIWISIKDDGKGLDRERILAKAIERGMVKVDPATVPDQEIWSYIFEPGFSTAQAVSEVSGRGVGMDVVKKNLERIRGAVDVRSTKGQGTEFILRIPLTMAIIDGITVRLGENFYSIPLNDILEFFKVRSDQITRTADGSETINLRSQILPLIKLWQVFKVDADARQAEEGILLVVQSGGRKACLLIDEVLGNQQIVIKSLSEYLGKVDGISGCSILGDGTVSFIVDTGRLLSLVLE